MMLSQSLAYPPKGSSRSADAGASGIADGVMVVVGTGITSISNKFSENFPEMSGVAAVEC